MTLDDAPSRGTLTAGHGDVESEGLGEMWHLQQPQAGSGCAQPWGLCPSRRGHVWGLAGIMMQGERVNESRKVLGCHREGAIKQDEDRATGKELPQVLDTESGCWMQFPHSVGGTYGQSQTARAAPCSASA